MHVFWEFLIRGMVSGAIYALLALPMSLMFAAARSLDFAVGAYALVAAAACATVAGPLGIPAGLLAAVICSSVMGGIFLILKHRHADDHVIVALASFGLSVAVSSLVLWQFGPRSFVKNAFSSFPMIAGVRVSPQGLINLATAVLIILGLYAVLYSTNLGRMMRASASNPSGAELAGIPVAGIQFGTYIAGGLLGGLAGILILYSAGMDFTSPMSLTLSGFGAALLFGIHQPLRALFGGIAMGVAEAMAAGYASGMVTNLVPFVFVLIVLSTSKFGECYVAGDRT